MPDDKRGREEQARHEDRRQRKRDVEEARERDDEPEPTDPGASDEEPAGTDLGDFETVLADQEYPVTARELVDAHGDHVVETPEGPVSVAELLGPVEATFDSAESVRIQIRKRIRAR